MILVPGNLLYYPMFWGSFLVGHNLDRLPLLQDHYDSLAQAIGCPLNCIHAKTSRFGLCNFYASINHSFSSVECLRRDGRQKNTSLHLDIMFLKIAGDANRILIQNQNRPRHNHHVREFDFLAYIWINVALAIIQNKTAI